ncbi:alkaline phosphatase D family protein [Roseateles cellulosilyticus]|uniref:Alkaline phosphatase family protein n=1 Tax=Pelomonas cellulosilytica TaxID=2906762 RepID=A0ABS8XSX9_9BURK|nr:alkaline phosphatase D family protein [Pelomonas sp. P8]MCE4553828.1 alkaline phosphatase family protein [Pelomonas sp. P8]
MATPSLDRRQLMLAAGLAAAGVGAQAGTNAGSRPLALGAPASPQQLRIAFGSCAKQSKPQPVWAAVRAARPELFLFLGDNLYADAQDADTLHQRYAEFRRVEALQSFRRDTPHLSIWDDHDFGDDDVGGDYPLKALSQQLFCDEWGEPAGSPRRTRPGIYEAYCIERAGRTVQILMLDLRFNRTPLVADPAPKEGYVAMVTQAKLSGAPMKGWYQPNLDPAATLLGEPQWAWLAERLAEPADVRLLVSSVQLAAEGTGWEGWANFPLERQRLVDLIREKRAEGIVVISGDMHYADLSRWDTPACYPLWDLTSSGLTEVWDIPTPNSRRVSAVYAGVNFGLVDMDFSTPAPTLQLSIRDVKGKTRLQQRLSMDQLRFNSKV